MPSRQLAKSVHFAFQSGVQGDGDVRILIEAALTGLIQNLNDPQLANRAFLEVVLDALVVQSVAANEEAPESELNKALRLAIGHVHKAIKAISYSV